MGWTTISVIYFIGSFVIVGGPFIPLMVYAGLMVVFYAGCWINTINEWERRPVMLFGRYIYTAGPGLTFIEPLFFTTLDDVPVQDLVIDVPVPNVQTKDNVSIGISGVLTYRIDPTKVRDAVVQVRHVASAIQERALTTLTDTAAGTDIDHLLADRKKFCLDIAEALRDRVSTWGVEIRAFEIKGFKINDKDVEQSIAMKARAEKEGAAELMRAQYQQRVAVALDEAARSYGEAGRWLKGMEVLVELSRSAQNHTIMIPSDLQNALAAATAVALAKPTDQAAK